LGFLLFVLFIFDDERLLFSTFLLCVIEGYPVEAKLLVVNHSITFNDLLLELLHLGLIHCLDLVVSLQVGLLKMLELSLELLELTGYPLVIGCQLLICILELLVLFFVLCA